MSVQSVVKIEYVVGGTAHELCAVGGWMSQNWKIRAEQDLHEPPPGYLAAERWFHPLGGAMAVVTFATEETFPDHASAQAAFMEPEVFDGVSLLQAAGTLRVTAGDLVAEWDDAVLEAVTPTMPGGDSVSTVVRAFAFRTPAVPSMA